VRQRLSQLEALDSAPFILVTGAIGGAVRGIPAFFLSNANVAGARWAQLIVALVLSLLSWTGAALLWWIAVRRRRFSIWWTACHVTLALAVADLLVTALSFVRASIETKGEIIFDLGSALPTVFVSNLGVTGIRSAFWLIEALVLVALGRIVLRMDERDAPQTSLPINPEVVA
jgi:hypothetical protein